MNFRRDCNDVTAVVLSLGEATTDDAIASLTRQTILPRHTIIVRDIVPFHKALNSGVAQVETPFFVQVDADMILDRHCIATLRRNVCSDVGIVVGHLRDSLIEQVVGIKLFRTECFNFVRFRDSVSPDTDFVNDIARAGWKTIYVQQKTESGKFSGSPTVGEHRRDYSINYTYLKFLAEGCRYRYRDTFGGFRGHLSRLAKSSHCSALVAQIALARGIFLEPEHDLLGRSHHDDEIQCLGRFLNSTEVAVSLQKSFELPSNASLKERFRHFYRIGFSLFQYNQIAAFRSQMSLFDQSADPFAWINKIACCKGLFEQDIDESRIAKDYAILRKFARWPVQPPYFNTTFDAIAAYAAEIGLKSFVIAGSGAAEYRTEELAPEPKYQRTERAVSMSVQSNRPRIAPPPRLLGHMACTEPENIKSLYWCFDLVRAGYLTLHVPTYLGPRRIRLVSQIISNVSARFRGQRAARQTAGDDCAKANSALTRLARTRTPRYEPEPNRILMVAGDLGRGGSERQMLAVASGLLSRGYEVSLVVLSRTGFEQPSFEHGFRNIGLVAQEASSFDIDLEGGFKRIAEADQAADLSRLLPAFSQEIIQLMTAIRTHRPQIVHAWLDHAGLSAALAATSLGTPSVVVQFGNMSPGSFSRQIRLRDYFRQGFRAIARNPTAILANNSARGARDYERWLRLRPGSIRIIRNGLMTGTVRIPSNEELSTFRSAMGLPPNVPVVGTVMRFTEEKDPDLWLAAAAEIAKAVPQVCFILAGCGELLEQCKARAQAIGLDRNIVFAGAIEDVGLIYGLLDVFLLTSRVEGLPNVLIEAQAAGCPVVTTDVGGAGEALVDGTTGRLVRQRSSDSLARAVLEVLFDQTWRERVNKQGADFIANRFGFERMVDRTLEIYRMPLRGSADYPVRGNLGDPDSPGVSGPDP